MADNTFEKGLSNEFSPLKQVKGTYPYAKNLIRDAQGTIKSEPGVLPIADFNILDDESGNSYALVNVVILGQTNVEEDNFYFIYSDEGSTIVRVDQEGVKSIVLHTGTLLGATPPSAGDAPTSVLIGHVISPSDDVLNVVKDPLLGGTFTYFVDFELINSTTAQATFRAVGDGGTGFLIDDSISGTTRVQNALPETFWPTAAQGFVATNDFAGGGSWQVQLRGPIGSTTPGQLQLDSTGSTGTRQFVPDNHVQTYDVEEYIASSIIDTDLLAFNPDSFVDAVGRKDYKGNTILYFVDGANVPRILDTATTTTKDTFDTDTTLVINPSLPRILTARVTETGALSSGLYKFAARLSTAGGNKSAFSQISNPTPIVEDRQSLGEINYDGVDPNTPSGKSINLTLSNIDTTYEFLEIAVITYESITNITVVNLIDTIPISGANADFTFYSEDQYTDTILEEELLSTAVNYSTAKNITQKDNHLFLSNLTTDITDSLDASIQDVANNIDMYYTIEEHASFGAPYSAETIFAANGTVAAWNTASDYQNPHSFLLTNQITTDYDGYKDPQKTFSRKTYQRDEVYSFALVPIFIGGIYGSAYHIPGDGVNYSNTAQEGSETTTKLRGWKNADGTIHHRMPSLKKEPVVTHESTVDIVTYRILGLEARGISFPEEVSSQLEGYVIVRQRRNTSLNGIVTMQGIAKNMYNGPSNTLVPAPHNGKTAMTLRAPSTYENYKRVIDTGVEYDLNENYFTFFSPDHIHGLVDDNFLASSNRLIQQKIRAVERICDNRKTTSSPGRTTFGAFFQDHYDATIKTNTDKTQLGKKISLSFLESVQPFSGDTPSNITLPDGKQVRTEGMNGGILGHTPDLLKREFTLFPGSGNNMNSQIDNGLFNNGQFVVHSEEETVEIYNLYNNHDHVYGDLKNAEYIKAAEFYFDTTPGTTAAFYGGDTFISKYTFHIGEQMLGSDTNLEYKTKTSCNIETYIETRGNYEYRHFSDTGIPYTPKYKLLLDAAPEVSGTLGVWDFTNDLGMPQEYNKHYNFENTINKYISVSNRFEVVTALPNRIIYSLPSVENEQFDAYRVFLPNNFHDIPKETGKITNTFEYNNTLYAHTPHALWRTYVNEKTLSNTSSGDIVLGNGGLFPIPSEKIYTQDGGYAGSEAKWASINTPFGRVFVDNHQRRVFQLVGKEQLKEISNPMMETYFRDSLLPNAVESTYIMGYDPIHKRMLLSTKGVDTISYDFELESWASFHSYVMSNYSYRDNKLLGIENGVLAEIGTGDPNVYFDGLYNSELHMVINDAPNVTKEFRNVKWIQRYKEDIFSQISLETESYTTGIIQPIIVTSFLDEQNFLPLGQQHVDLIGGEHRMTIPPDNSGGYTDELFRPAIKGKYGILKLEHIPANNPLELEYFDTEHIKVAE